MFDIGREYCFAVTVGLPWIIENRSFYFFIVIDLAVEYDRVAARGVVKRLVRRFRKIDYRKTPVPERSFVADKKTVGVRPSVSEPAGHVFDFKSKLRSVF